MINWSDLSIGSIIETEWRTDYEKCGQSVVYRIEDNQAYSIFEKEYRGMCGDCITESEIDWLIENGIIDKASDVKSRLYTSQNNNIEKIVGHVSDTKEGIVYDW